MTADSQPLKKVAEIYDWLDSQTSSYNNLCKSCGQCCYFANLDHRLFVTTPEVMYLAANLGGKNIKPMTANRCPYLTDGKCSVYKYRFAGCRIFCCKADKDVQSRLSESALKKLKSICEEFQIPYRYIDLAIALNGWPANTYQPAERHGPASTAG
jgi:Fe-S-cluster containining protein